MNFLSFDNTINFTPEKNKIKYKLKPKIKEKKTKNKKITVKNDRFDLLLSLSNNKQKESITELKETILKLSNDLEILEKTNDSYIHKINILKNDIKELNNKNKLKINSFNDKNKELHNILFEKKDKNYLINYLKIRFSKLSESQKKRFNNILED